MPGHTIVPIPSSVSLCKPLCDVAVDTNMYFALSGRLRRLSFQDQTSKLPFKADDMFRPSYNKTTTGASDVLSAASVPKWFEVQALEVKGFKELR
ncbi:hypothetical protein T265_09930 [Opisthorchis viverrini]|uniref:Uncharacterized protein n=1 Tax=Opisthorchis viverrini TaxID=6198 RepID=A0A074ZF28_OPIVI|nr:hypothetical protein T265_09930 [Opisthorchis viverrini]KER21835.1 hypothetical protein T265_09930 [Opisthorchis viverrini]